MKEVEEKEKKASEYLTSGATEISKDIGKLLIYFDDERKNYEQLLLDDPESAKKHIWLHLKNIVDWEYEQGKQKRISVVIDHEQPVLDLLVSTVDDFLNKLLDGCPKTYYVTVEIGNKHPSMVTIPTSKTFRGNGEPLKV